MFNFKIIFYTLNILPFIFCDNYLAIIMRYDDDMKYFYMYYGSLINPRYVLTSVDAVADWHAYGIEVINSSRVKVSFPDKAERKSLRNFGKEEFCLGVIQIEFVNLATIRIGKTRPKIGKNYVHFNSFW